MSYDQSAALSATVSTGDDMLTGGAEIAEFLNWPLRKVQRARNEGWSIPIRKADGIGLYAFKSELDAYLRDEATLPRRVA